MKDSNLDELAALIDRESEVLLSRWRQEVRRLPSARNLDTPALNDHIPALLAELSAAVLAAHHGTLPDRLAGGSPPVHGRERYREGFDLVEVVTEYSILRGCLHDLAEAHGLRLHGKAFHIVNRVIDEAIGLAVQTFVAQQALEVQRRRDEHLAFVSHDLRTPLNAVSLAARTLELAYWAGDRGVDTARSMMSTLRRNVRYLQELLEAVASESADLEAEDGVRLERRSFDLWPVVEALTEDLEPIAATSGTDLVNETPHESTVYADVRLLRRILQNLLANAIRFTPRGVVRIGARTIGDGGGVECWVRDNGAGIPLERLATLFDQPGSDVEPEGDRKLGLSIVKSFVEAHGGEVTAESEEGSGSTFRFTLPGPPANADRSGV